MYRIKVKGASINMYKIIALDMDGTLLNDSKEITEITKSTLKEARSKGIKIVLASGRPIDGLKNYLSQLNLMEDNEYVLSYNGCLVQETKSGKVIHSVGLKGKDLKYMYEVSKKLNVNIHAFSNELGLITPKISKYTKLEADINDIKVNVVDFNEIPDDEDIIKVMMIDEEDIIDEAIKNMPEEILKKYTTFKSAPYFLEIINKEADKGEGLKALAEYLDVKREEIIAIGDAENDLAMIQYAGLGVAMKNASEAVKEVSDCMTESNEEDGVAKLIIKKVLN